MSKKTFHQESSINKAKFYIVKFIYKRKVAKLSELDSFKKKLNYLRNEDAIDEIFDMLVSSEDFEEIMSYLESQLVNKLSGGE